MKNDYEPTAQDWAWLDHERKIVGSSLPVVDRGEERTDKFAWKRQAAANRLGVKQSELADEPDYLAIDEQGYE